MKIKLDDYDVRFLVACLYRQRTAYDEKINTAIDGLILRLADIYDTMKHNKRKKIAFELVETRLIRRCLLNWWNEEIQNESGVTDYISEMLLQFAG